MARSTSPRSRIVEPRAAERVRSLRSRPAVSGSRLARRVRPALPRRCRGTGIRAGLARFLAAQGGEVLELDRPDRSARLSTASATSSTPKLPSGECCPAARPGPRPVAASWRPSGCSSVYRSAVKDRTATTNHFHAITTTRERTSEQLQHRTVEERIANARRWTDRTSDNTGHGATRRALRARTADHRSGRTSRADRGRLRRGNQRSGMGAA